MNSSATTDQTASLLLIFWNSQLKSFSRNKSDIRQEKEASPYIWGLTVPLSLCASAQSSWLPSPRCVHSAQRTARFLVEMVQRVSGIPSAEAQEEEMMTCCQHSPTGGAIQKPAIGAILHVFHQDNNPTISGIKTNKQTKKKPMLIIPKNVAIPNFINENINFQT